MIKIAPSILSADFTNLKQDIIDIDKAGADMFHIDIMDGNFVPNISFGSMIVKQIRPLTKKNFDVHLMVATPEKWVDDFISAGANIITFHYEATIHHDRLISSIKEKGVKVGIALNPSTNENVLKYLIDKLDLVLVMSVNPGFGGQKFLSSQIAKIKSIKENYIKNKDILLEVDGGVNDKNAPAIIKAGANLLVAGSSVFNNQNYYNNIKKIRGV